MGALGHLGTGGNSRAAEETNTALTNVGGAWVVFVQAYWISSPRGGTKVAKPLEGLGL